MLRLLALWALVHETADEAWKSAVARGEGGEASPQDALAALVNREKNRLRQELAAGDAPGEDAGRLTALAEEIRFELAQMRGRIESIETSLRSLDERTPPPRA
jgi:hypothetical protein